MLTVIVIVAVWTLTAMRCWLSGSLFRHEGAVWGQWATHSWHSSLLNYFYLKYSTLFTEFISYLIHDSTSPSKKTVISRGRNKLVFMPVACCVTFLYSHFIDFHAYYSNFCVSFNGLQLPWRLELPGDSASPRWDWGSRQVARSR